MPKPCKLEEHLLNADNMVPNYDHEIDVLRLVLQGSLGTPPQRNALCRIIRANKPVKRIGRKLFGALNEPLQLGQYMNRQSFLP